MRMNDWIDIRRDEAHIARERRRARELRRGAWWQAQRDRGICHYCRRQVPPDQLTMDHVVPVARGGQSRRGNVVPCCAGCNRDKGCATRAEIILDRMDIT